MVDGDTEMTYLLDAPANTTSYMIAGYAVIFGAILIYILSLYIRRRNLRQDMEMLESLQEKTNDPEFKEFADAAPPKTP
jgi:hypothetical protein